MKEAEKAFVGSILSGYMAGDVDIAVKALYEVSPEHFSVFRYRALVELLKNNLHEKNIYNLFLNAGINIDWIHTILDNSVNVQYAFDFALTVKDNWLLRQIEPALAACKSGSGLKRLSEIKKVVENLEGKVLLSPIDESRQMLENYITQKNDTYKTGIVGIDKWTGGFEPGDMIIIAGRPGTGKTALMLSIAYSMSRYEKQNVSIYSYEMESYKLRRRLVSMHTGIPIHIIRRREFSDNEKQLLLRANDEISGYPIQMHTYAGRTLEALIAAIMSSQSKVVFIDYIQLIRLARSSYGRYDIVTEVSTTLMQTAKATQKVIVGLSQLNREIDKMNRKPVLSDLRESGALEQDADLIMLLHRPEQLLLDVEDITLIGAKFREGRQIEHNMKFNKSISRFYDETRIEYEQETAF